MMNYDDFIEYVKENILEKLPDVYREFEVSVSKTMKNNGLELDGLTIRGHDNIAPVIYLNGYYEKYTDGNSLDNIMSEISDVYKISADHRFIPIDLAEKIVNFEEVKENIFSKIINTADNKVLLEDRPHTEFEDLSITYHIMISSDISGTASVPITNSMAEEYGVTAKELDKIAQGNMSRNNPMTFESMYNLMKDMFVPNMINDGMDKDMAESMFDDMFPDEGVQMYVMTNESKVNGAVWMTNADALETVSEKVGGDFFLLPASLHECIIVPCNDLEADKLQEMVIECNNDCVMREDRLSNNVYAYDSKEHKLSLATDERTHDMNKEHDMEHEQKHSSIKH